MLNDRKPRPAETGKGPQRLDISRFAPANRRRLSPPGLRTFLAIADLWGLTEEQRLLVLGYPSRSTYHNWCKQAREHGAFTLDVDVLSRISAVLGIHQGLGILFPTEQLGVEWLRTPHNAVVFGGRPPLDLVTSGSKMGCSRSAVSSTARVAVSTCSRTRLTRRSRLTTTRKLSSGDGCFCNLTAARPSPDSVAISSHRAVRYGRDRGRSYGRNGAGRLDQR